MTLSAITSATGGIRRPGAPLLVVLTAVALLLLPSAARAAAVGGAGATVPTGGWPLSPTPTVVRGFDPPTSTWGAGHRGVDLAGTVGEPVHAALSGTVTFAGPLAGRGVVVVDHGSTRTTYEPVTPGVAVGDEVAAGAVLGTLTIVQSHCLPAACLHWGWIRDADDVYLDPLGLIGLGRPVRLLPLWRAGPAPRIGSPYVGLPGPATPALLRSVAPYGPILALLLGTLGPNALPAVTG